VQLVPQRPREGVEACFGVIVDRLLTR
jgi:hypothetical protein